MANPTIGFIGYGNMAQAIAEGWSMPAQSAAATLWLVRHTMTSWNVTPPNLVRKRCIPLHKWPKLLTWSLSPSNRIRLKR